MPRTATESDAGRYEFLPIMEESTWLYLFLQPNFGDHSLVTSSFCIFIAICNPVIENFSSLPVSLTPRKQRCVIDYLVQGSSNEGHIV